MKIALFHELPKGGARMVVNEMARRLKKEHTVDFYTTSPSFRPDESSLFTATNVYEFKTKTWLGGNWKIRLYKDTIELIKLYLSHRKIAIDIRNKNYDIVFIHASSYIEAPFLLRFPNKNKIFYCHDPNYRFVYDSILGIKKNLGFVRYAYEVVNRFIRKKLDKDNIRGADVLIASSMFEKRVIKKTYDIDSKVIYYGVDVKYFKKQKKSKVYDVLFVGTSHPLEGFLFLQKVLRHLPKKIKIKTLLGDKKWTEKDELRNTYVRSKTVICLAYNEPFGLIPLDAMACGVPVVAVEEGGYKETIVDGRTGYLVKRDPKLIAKKIQYLLKNDKLRQLFGNNGRRHVVKNWTWEKNIQELNKLFKWTIKQ